MNASFFGALKIEDFLVLGVWDLELTRLLLASRPFAENSGAYSHQCRTFLHGDDVVVCHAHRQLSKIDMKLGLKLIAELAELNKIFPRRFSFFRQWRDRHH